MGIFLRRNALERESEMWACACVEFIKRPKCLCVCVYSCLNEAVKCVFACFGKSKVCEVKERQIIMNFYIFFLIM